MALATQSSRARLGRWILAVAILTSAVGLGALHTPVLAVCAVLALISTALLWYDDEPLAPRPAATVLIGLAVLLVLWTALQTVPLPRGIVSAIAAPTADVWAHALAPLREDGPAWVTLSLDPAASRVQILRGVTYLAVFVAALRVARRQEGVVFLERAVLFSTLVVAAAGLMHPVLGARKVFGLYEPGEAYATQHLAPLLNTNHLAAYANIGALLALPSVLQRRLTIPRPLALVISLLLGAMTMWTFSRGGGATLVLGVVLVAFLTFGARSERGERAVLPLALALVSIGGALTFLIAGFDGFRERLGGGNPAKVDLSKVDLVKNAFALLRDYPLFGVGRGAFESTFPKVRVGTNYVVFTHPENVVAQWCVEWGLPVAILGFLAIAWALRPRSVLARSRPPVGPWAALVAVGIHNLCDFSSEVPGVVVALVVCAAAVTGGTGGGSPRSHRGAAWASHPRAITVALGIATLLAIAMTLPFSGHELYNEERAFRDVGLDRAISREAFHERAREAMIHHPAEAYFPFVGAVRATVMRDESALPWAARALERSPVYGRAHLMLARSLYTKSPAQARLEYRVACEQDASLCTVDEALPLVSTFDDALELVPAGAAGTGTLRSMAAKLAPRLPSTVVRIDREITRRDPAALEPVQRAAARAVGDVGDAEIWCASAGDQKRVSCIAEGLAEAERLRQAFPEECEGHALTAELRVLAGDVDRAYADFDGAIDRVEKKSVCARRLVALAVRIGNPARIDAAVDRLTKLGCEAPGECATNLSFAAGVESRNGSNRRALSLARRAWESAPERDDLLIDVATRAANEGVHGEAMDAYTKLADRHPEDRQWTESAAREREALTRGVLDRRP